MTHYREATAGFVQGLEGVRIAIESAAEALLRSADAFERLLQETSGRRRTTETLSRGSDAASANAPALLAGLQAGFDALVASSRQEKKELASELGALLRGASGAPTVTQALGSMETYGAAPLRPLAAELLGSVASTFDELLRGLDLGAIGAGLGGGLGGHGKGASLGRELGAAGVGALAGSLIPGIGTAIGSLAGGLIGSLTGGLFDAQDKPALAVAHLVSDGAGLRIEEVQGRNGGNTRAAEMAAEDFGQQLGKLVALAGGRLGAGLDLALGRDEKRGFFVEGPGFGGTETRRTTRRVGGRDGDTVTSEETLVLDRKFFGGDEDAARDFAFRQGMAQAAEGLDDAMRAVVERSLSLREDVEAVFEDVTFARNFELALEGLRQGSVELADTIGGEVRAEVERTAEALHGFVARSAELGLATGAAEEGARQAIETLLGLRDSDAPLGAFAEALERTKRLFAEMGPLAQEFGISLAALAEGLSDAVEELEQDRDRAVAGFSSSLDVRLLRAGGEDQAAALLDFDGRTEGEIERARQALIEMGATAEQSASLLAKLEATLSAERLALVESYGEKARQALEQATRGLGDWLERQVLGPLSILSPLEKLKEAERQFETLLASAATGDGLAARDLAQAADRLLTLADAVYGATPDFVAIHEEVRGAVENLLGDIAVDETGGGASLALHAVASEQAIALEGRLIDPAREAVAQLETSLATVERGLAAPVVDIGLARVVEALRQQTTELARGLEAVEESIEQVYRELRDARTLSKFGSGSHK